MFELTKEFRFDSAHTLRRVLSGLAAEGSGAASLELLIDRMRTFPSNDAFLAEIGKAPSI